eukprot:scaffold39649_cov20-Tisochrysis_lutea.AAC.1
MTSTYKTHVRVCQEDLDVYDEFAVTRCNNFYHQDEVCLHQECRTAWPPTCLQLMVHNLYRTWAGVASNP